MMLHMTKIYFLLIHNFRYSRRGSQICVRFSICISVIYECTFAVERNFF